MYTIYGKPTSRALRVLWLLEELELPYEQVAAAPRSDEVRAVNPLGKVPVLEVDGVAISDSTAIMTFLADKHGKFTFPAGTLERARQDAITHFLLDEFDACLWVAARHSFILPEEMRHPAVKESLKWEFARSLKHLTHLLADGPFLMGETMTVPDIIAAHCCRWARSARFPLDEPAVADYADRLTARPAFRRAVEAG